MNATAQAGPLMTRHSLLKRNPAHSKEFFSSYYQHHHGPLAARQAGFRKFTTRYLQNHVLDLPDGSEPLFDGISMTTQVPRDDYSVGFFGEPDYANVKDDELYLFDLSATVSLLGESVAVREGPASAFKAVFLGSGPAPRLEFPGIVKLVANRLDLRTVSALGFRAAAFEHDLLAEIWFGSAEDRLRAFAIEAAARTAGGAARLLPVREVIIFGGRNEHGSD